MNLIDLDVILLWDNFSWILENPGCWVCQLQQETVEQNLSQRYQGGLFKFYASNILEQWLSIGVFEFPNLRPSNAAQPGNNLIFLAPG